MEKAARSIITSPRSESEAGEITTILLYLDDRKDEELDQLLVKNLSNIFVGDGNIYPRTDSTWRWYGEEILEGEYPLENLPEHVRDIAKELYYS